MAEKSVMVQQLLFYAQNDRFPGGGLRRPV